MKKSNILPKPELTHFQRRRDGKEGDSLGELIKYIDQCSKWKGSSCVIGYLDADENAIISYKVKGPRCFIQSIQTPDNRFYFSFLESQSLIYANRLILLSKDSNGIVCVVSPHRLLNYILSKNISFDSCKKYNIFSRIGASKAKILPKEDENKQEVSEVREKKGFRLLMEKFRNEKKIRSSYPKKMFPQLEYVKFPGGHGLPDNGFISINSKSKFENPEIPTIVPISLKYLVQINVDPGLNNIK